MYENTHKTMTVAQIINAKKFPVEKKTKLNTRFKRIQLS